MNLLIYFMLNLIFVLSFIWYLTIIMLQIKKIIVFLPFFIIGILYLLQSSFIYYSLYVNFVWLAIELTFLINLIWIFILYIIENIRFFTDISKELFWILDFLFVSIILFLIFLFSYANLERINKSLLYLFIFLRQFLSFSLKFVIPHYLIL